MSSLPNRPNTALLIVDVQRDVVAGAHDRDGVIANINTLLERARGAGTPVIWVQHADDGLPEGSDGWQYVEELQREDSEPLVHKHFGDSFEETDLEESLAGTGTAHVVLAGAQSNWCIRATAYAALDRGYEVVTHRRPELLPNGNASARRAGSARPRRSIARDAGRDAGL